jgi:hypothetical protein
MTEDNLKRYLKEKKSVRLSRSFDDNMMALIKKHALYKSKKKKYLSLMYLLFVLGLLSGFTIAVTLVDTEVLIGSVKFSVNKIFLQIPLISVILFLFEKIYKATLVDIGKEEFSSI